MKCPICGKQMWRVVNEKGSAFATCSKCNQYVECAVCDGHIVICPPCYAKPAGPRKQSPGPLVSDEAPF